MKERITACFKCDLNNDELFDIPYFKKVEVIVSSLTMESAVVNFEHYERILQNFRKYLKPQGYIYLFGCLEETFYVVKGKKLPCLYLTEYMIKSTLTKNNFKIISFDTLIWGHT